MPTSPYDQAHYVMRDRAGIIYRAPLGATPGEFSPGKSADGCLQHTLDTALRKRRGYQRRLAPGWSAVVVEMPNGTFEIGGYLREGTQPPAALHPRNDTATASTHIPFQERIARRMPTAFDNHTISDPQERGMRITEQALELAQSVGMTHAQAHRIAADVFTRPAGETTQEVGGVMVCLAALCNATQIDMDDAAYREIARCEGSSETIRRKHAKKRTRGLTTSTADTENPNG